MSFLQAFGGVLSLLLVVLTGFFLARRGLIPAPCIQILPRFITNVSLPPFLACTIISTLRHESIGHLFYGALIPLFQMSCLFCLACLVARLVRVPPKRFGLFCACVSNPNTIFIGIPVSVGLFGDSSVSYVLIYYFASTCFFWTVGNYFIGRDESASGSPGQIRQKRGEKLRKIVSPPLLGFICGVMIISLDISVPAFIFQGASILGQATTPLALIFIGITLHGIDWRSFRLNKDIIIAICGRMIVSPLLMIFILSFINLPQLMSQVFIIQSSLPVLMQVAILSAYYRTDPQFGSIMVALSTVLCALTIPVYRVLI